MAFSEAKETLSQIIRWIAQPKNNEDKTIFLGEVIEGYYKDKKTDVGQNKSNLYEIVLKDGQLVAVWGSGLLDGKFEEIPVGVLVRITYLGIAQPKKAGGRQYQNFRVEYDVDQKIPANFKTVEAKQEVPAAGNSYDATVVNPNPGF